MNGCISTILSGNTLKVLFLNDTGFQYGAGIAHLRQIQSFLILGHDVYGICWQQGAVEESIPFIPVGATGCWHGMREFPELDCRGKDISNLVHEAILHEIISIDPDIVIAGNLHGGGWSIELLQSINAQGYPVIAFMHDCHYITGRCAYPFDCELFVTGCDSRCPTANQYPTLSPELVEPAWKYRQGLFSNYPGIALAANSLWTLNMARRTLPHVGFADVVHLGLDHMLFSALDRKTVRAVLGLPENAFIIIAGAVNVKDFRKGGFLFEQIVSRLSDKALFFVFGRDPMIQGVKATGLIRDYRKMPLLYSAADLFVGTSLAESFGQTYCEAAACGLPVVAFRVGGIPDIARHNVNARLVDEIKVEPFLDEISFFMNSPAECLRYGRAGRTVVESEFTLEHQATRWQNYLKGFAEYLGKFHLSYTINER